MRQVVKFGGSSLRDAEAIAHVCDLISKFEKQTVVVVSAMQGITDLLIEGAQKAVSGEDYKENVTAFRLRHLEAISALLPKQNSLLAQTADEFASELESIFKSLSTLGETTTGIMDRVVSRGERMMANLIVGYLNAKRFDAELIDARGIIQGEMQFGNFAPHWDKIVANCTEQIIPYLEKNSLVIVPGFIGENIEGKLMTLGRGGTDFSATIIAKAVSADEVRLFKEVDGIMTADPRHVPEARVVPELSYREATELAYYGAKVLHSRTLIPLIEGGIPLYIQNTFNPGKDGTKIHAEAKPGAYPVKAITAISEQSIISIEGKGMLGVPGIAARTFSTLSNIGTSVSVISQASSEASICFVVPDKDRTKAVKALGQTFQFEIEAGLIDRISFVPNQSIIAIVGMGMKGTPGISSRVFKALGRVNTNIEAIAQGSSELNISLVINTQEKGDALQSIHREFRLEKIHTAPNSNPGQWNYSIFGLGQIGRTLLKQIINQMTYFDAKMDLQLRCLSLADSSGIIIHKDSMSINEIEETILSKEQGYKLIPNDEKLGMSDWPLFLKHKLFDLGIDNNVFIDLTAEETWPLIMDAIKTDHHVVIANKKPLTVKQEQFDELFDLAKSKQVAFRYEATVGAGLPILDTLAKLSDAGDEILEIHGCLSGTLGFLMSELQAGTKFSEAVNKAYRRGFTEPDPRDDLSGVDVARKAVILARTLGIRCELSDIPIEALFPEHLSDNDPAKFIQNLSQVNDQWQERLIAAKTNGNVLRYVASIEKDQINVGIREVAADSPTGQLKGTDNQVTIRTRRYDENPLIVTGPGAGAEVTASGVLNDLLAITAMKDFQKQ